MPKKLFILSYDIHSPSDLDSEDEWTIEALKRKRMRDFIIENRADEVCKSTYVFSSDSTSQKIYENIMKNIIVLERDGDCIYVAEIAQPQHTRVKREEKEEYEKTMKMAGISK